MLTLLDGTRFHLHRRNVGPLSFEILDGGDDKPDHDLEIIWKKYAAADVSVCARTLTDVAAAKNACL